MTLYYQDDYVTRMSPRGPITPRTGAEANRVLSGNFGFDRVTGDDLRPIFSRLGAISQGWVVANMDYKHAFEFDQSSPEGLRVLRVGVWVKTNPNPQIRDHRETVRARRAGSWVDGMIQPATPTSHAGYRIRPARTQGGYRVCHRCGIDFPLNSRSVWTRQTHCKDCRHYQRKDDQ